ncbi:FAD-dependent monooxygenase [Asaia bogorensis]|uniref:FAD-dependent monooxygenase n=1 Tax=Asaia bogorensis TaxID=91915 RepID=UPI0013CE740B|nr:FAD-dependent monooxygenase [Asaia bogorensis]
MTKRALIVGLGITGMSAAIALMRQGWVPVIAERAPDRRKGGYFIGLRDEGREAARQLGVLNRMEKRTPARLRFWDIRRDGSRKVVADLTGETETPIAVMRGDIEEALWQSIEGRVEIRFESYPTLIEAAPNGVVVRLNMCGTDADEETYDLVIGADGVHSQVRRMIFGPDRRFVHPLKTSLCAFPLLRPVPGLEPGDGLMIADTRRTLTIFPLEGRPSTALFSYRRKKDDPLVRKAPASALRKIFSGLDVGGVVSAALEDLEKSDDYLSDDVQMIKMPHWSKGRVILLGDAAWCLTLYSGMGASAGMMGGVALGAALAAYPDDTEAALRFFEAGMRPFIRRHQRFVRIRAELFVPSTILSLRARRMLWQVMRRFRNKEGRVDRKSAR